jgi:hypothetical protein
MVQDLETFSEFGGFFFQILSESSWQVESPREQ